MRLPLFLLTTSLALIAALKASATLIAYDGFILGDGISTGYTEGADIDGVGFGSGDGWTGANATTYATSNTPLVASATALTYTTGAGQILTTSGGSASGNGTFGSRNGSTIRGVTYTVNDGESLWMSYLIQYGRLEDTLTYFGAGLRNGAGTPTANNGFAAIVNDSDVNNDIGVRYTNTNQFTTDLDAPINDTMLVVMKWTYSDGGNDPFSIWFNPNDISSEAALGAADLVNNSRNMNIAGDVILYRQKDATASSGFYIIDEVRLATTLADAAPFTPVPEPSTYALFGGFLGLATVALFRRKKFECG
ncbi:PEP-CTERM sorting domain-containing protein [Rubellicoccus peritrichatus]|uniref:PEP-CTERM sorting domain-containing protein n=1 Tax=Rubellicoccus peritrichatus TaxID=3080537 RepID=A0AAQ3QVV0_9BACT|nr:PEP-CTERM sorting domain-containing protein [Puniceicoccus sp. CR14]WOO41237.1 PEP-CTERM sorting domain-containing protein [Puniceicoccus sp. CR14]